MNDERLLEQMKKKMDTPQVDTQNTLPEVVLVEFPVTSTELHNIANGSCKQFNDRDCPFSIRFMLKDSFKSSKSDFVINKYMIQIVVSETKQFMKKEDITTRIKVVKRDRKTKTKKEPIKEEIRVEESNESLF